MLVVTSFLVVWSIDEGYEDNSNKCRLTFSTLRSNYWVSAIPACVCIFTSGRDFSKTLWVSCHLLHKISHIVKSFSLDRVSNEVKISWSIELGGNKTTLDWGLSSAIRYDMTWTLSRRSKAKLNFETILFCYRYASGLVFHEPGRIKLDWILNARCISVSSPRLFFSPETKLFLLLWWSYSEKRNIARRFSWTSCSSTWQISSSSNYFWVLFSSWRWALGY